MSIKRKWRDGKVAFLFYTTFPLKLFSEDSVEAVYIFHTRPSVIITVQNVSSRVVGSAGHVEGNTTNEHSYPVPGLVVGDGGLTLNRNSYKNKLNFKKNDKCIN